MPHTKSWMIQAAFFNISRFLFFTKHSIIDCSCKSSNYKFVVWPFKKTKKTKQTILYRLFWGVFSRVWEKQRGITCVLQQYCCIENTSNCHKCCFFVLVFFSQQVNGQCYVKSGYICWGWSREGVRVKFISMSELMFYESAPGNVNGNAVT